MGVEVEAGVQQRVVAARQHVDRAAQLDEQVAVIGEPGGERGGDVVGHARDDGDPLCRPVCSATTAVTAPMT